ncbi:MAG: twin-arginine translocase TatA/TatE family subunit [Chloroflexota bacterium]|nr:twin-arginine translocase TatA/TatE family subunit [Chloroflexota bacterium]
MFGIGTGEILLLLVLALIVLGPERMPKLARDLGRALAEFRKTSDELRTEFLNADKYLDVAANATPAAPAAIPATATPEPPLTEAAVATDVAPEPDETAFDKEAREARERLRDPERLQQAAAEGWKTPTDEAGTSDRWG